MFNHEQYSIFLHRDKIDFRKSIDGLCAIIKHEMLQNPMQKSLFLFRNKNRDKIKILYWDDTGYALWYKRLEKNLFPWPIEMEDKTIYISHKQFSWLLQGIDSWKIKPHAKLFIV